MNTLNARQLITALLHKCACYRNHAVNGTAIGRRRRKLPLRGTQNPLNEIILVPRSGSFRRLRPIAVPFTAWSLIYAAKPLILAGAFSVLSAPVLLAAAPKQPAPAPKKPVAVPKQPAPALLPPSFYNSPSFSQNARPYEKLLAKNQYARDQSCRFNKILRGDTHRPRIALTFDDGPHPVYTLQLLNILRRMHTPATFFVVGEQVEKNPGLVRLEVAEGNEVGDHTYDHVNLTLIPPELVAYEVSRCDAAITKATGAPVRFFRPPGGEYNGEVLREVAGHGYITTLWTNDPGDFMKPSSVVIRKRTLAHLENGGIILLHDGIPETLEALPGIITAARLRGYQFVTVSQLAHAH